MVVICPADDIEARQAVKAAYKYEVLFILDSAGLQFLFSTMMITNLKSARVKLSKRVTTSQSSLTA